MLIIYMNWQEGRKGFCICLYFLLFRDNVVLRTKLNIVVRKVPCFHFVDIICKRKTYRVMFMQGEIKIHVVNVTKQ